MQFSDLEQPTYDPYAVQPMRDALTAVGFDELTTPDEVDQALNTNNNQTVLVMINSVCGCAAGNARPGVSLSLQHNTIPDRFVTVFAGQDKAAIAHLRERYLGDYHPSSPFIAMMKNGEVIYVLQRQDIERRTPQDIADLLTGVYDQQCNTTGPSISQEDYDKVIYAVTCGSKIPKFDEN